MQTKLTLRLEQQLIEQAKLHAKARGTSVSKMVADFFLGLEESGKERELLPPLVSSLYGVLENTQATESEYHRHLEKKYLSKDVD